MTRSEFVKLSAMLGISVPFQSILSSCANKNVKSGNQSNSFVEKVIIVGAGPAGMTAGYLLAQQGVDCQILEATGSFGGRIACATSISNFPTPLGAEWVHTSVDLFSEIVNNPSVDTSTPQLVGYNAAKDLQDVYSNGVLTTSPLGEGGAGDDRKFINSCWKEFFGKYIVPSIADKILYNMPVTAIDYSGEQVIVTPADGNTYVADKCIITVPLKILQEGSINFTPVLPNKRQKAISSLKVMPGFKCFLKTSKKFYNTYLLFDDSFVEGGQWIYYDAAYGQNTDDNILGFLCVGSKAMDYPYSDSTKLLEHITLELKGIYGSDQVEILDFEYTNWDEVPYVKGSYLGIEADGEAIAYLSKPIGNLHFAGSAYTNQAQGKGGGSGNWGFSENWSNVQAATRAAKRAVEEVLA